MSSPQWQYIHIQTRSHGLQANIDTELKARAAAFKERDTNLDAYKKSRDDLRHAIKESKCQYRTKIEFYFAGGNTPMWHGLQTITDYKGKPSRELPSDTSLPDELNSFYFEARNTEPYMSTPAVLDDCMISLSATNVSKNFKQVQIHKAVGSDKLPGRILRAGKCFHWHFQPLPDPVYNAYMYQADPHSPCVQERQGNL
jgi:hypothetical protein